MTVKSISLRQKEEYGCDDVRANFGKSSSAVLPKVLQHFRNCSKCNPYEFIQHLKEKRTRLMYNQKMVSKTVARFVAKMIKHFDNEVIREAGSWFIVNTAKFDVKVELSRWLTPEQVFEAIKHHVADKNFREHWPIYEYTQKFQTVHGFVRKGRTTPEEDLNDLLFKGACTLDRKIILKCASVDEFKRLAEVSEVMNG